MKHVDAATLPQSDFEAGTMAAELHDPTKPAGHLIERREDGSALRNDGVELMPASQNPWYVLATVYGQQIGIIADQHIHKKNRRIWNGWACGQMDNKQRESLSEKMGWPVGDIVPLTKAEREDLKNAFAERLPEGSKIPSPTEMINFSGIFLDKSLSLSACVFSSHGRCCINTAKPLI